MGRHTNTQFNTFFTHSAVLVIPLDTHTHFNTSFTCLAVLVIIPRCLNTHTHSASVSPALFSQYCPFILQTLAPGDTVLQQDLSSAFDCVQPVHTFGLNVILLLLRFLLELLHCCLGNLLPNLPLPPKRSHFYQEHIELINYSQVGYCYWQWTRLKYLTLCPCWKKGTFLKMHVIEQLVTWKQEPAHSKWHFIAVILSYWFHEIITCTFVSYCFVNLQSAMSVFSSGGLHTVCCELKFKLRNQVLSYRPTIYVNLATSFGYPKI